MGGRREREDVETFDPATEERLGQVAHGAAEDIDLAVAAARRCFDDPRSDWRRMTPSERGKVIHRIGDLILAHADELAELEAVDNGKPLSRRARRGRAAGRRHVPLHVGLGDEDRRQDHPDLRLTSPGVGVPVAYPAGAGRRGGPDHSLEFPVADGGLEARPRRWRPAATVVLKAAEQTPLSALRLGELILEAGLPDGVVNIVTGFGETAGAALAAHDGVDKVAFTGSTEVGG